MIFTKVMALDLTHGAPQMRRIRLNLQNGGCVGGKGGGYGD